MYHIPVLYNEILENMIKDEYKIYVDCTLGGGGHSQGILNHISKNAKLISIDQDIEAINYCKERLKDYNNLIIVKDNFINIDKILYYNGIEYADAILMDIGVSSNQLDNADRGFSYKYDSKLDMRMNKDQKLSAYEVVNNFSEGELAEIIYKYGEEPYAKKIAKKIVYKRKEKKIATTLELANIVIEAIGKSMKRHPAKRTFQAIRIYVNNELEILKDTLYKAVNLLNNKGRLLVITFHSLEDRIVKETFKEFESDCICPEHVIYCICDKKPLGKVLNKKVIKASIKENKINKRAHSSKLRIFERIK